MIKSKDVVKIRRYTFKSKVWKYKGHAGWYFVTLPKKLSRVIRHCHGLSEEGWGRLKADASIGECKWKTAIWFDTKAASYLLPIKAVIRKDADISEGQTLSVTLRLQIDNSRFGLLKRTR